MSSKNKSTASRNKNIVNILYSVLRVALSPLGKRRRDTMLSILSETIIPIANISAQNKVISFWGFGGWSLYRGRSVLEKEPITISWIDSFDHDCVFWDIGANVGVFSIYAAVTKNTKTYSFEPSAANMVVLCKNVELNKMDNTITALPIAFSNNTKIDYLNMISTAAGNTGGQFSHKDEKGMSIFKQSCLGFTIDDFIEKYDVTVPNYIKIDVDGIETMILEGAQKTLTDKVIKSIILEVDTKSEEYKNIKNLLSKHGFEEKGSEPTVRGKNRDHMCNMIFSR